MQFVLPAQTRRSSYGSELRPAGVGVTNTSYIVGSDPPGVSGSVPGTCNPETPLLIV